MTKYVLYVKHDNPDNDIVIHCTDINDIAKYAGMCIRQGYREVKAVVELEAQNG